MVALLLWLTLGLILYATTHAGEKPLWRLLVARAATADTAQALRSLDAVAGTGAQTVLTGHGEPWRRGAAAMADEARAAQACPRRSSSSSRRRTCSPTSAVLACRPPALR
jgi:hypothetical protein